MKSADDILLLARAGSTAFALSEFTRLGLDQVRHNEDIMALHGRLYKDVYLSESGSAAREAARLSAEKYEAAFKDTGGYYSGINAATMSLLAGYDMNMVRMRAHRILELLPPTGALEAEDKYFVEATRAEAQLLIRDETGAAISLRIARDHDPLNFVAHASTLKQFRMIAAHRNETYEWLREFAPPTTAHFAGHMFGIETTGNPDLPTLSQEHVNALSITITEALQTHDIGFVYGGLAAGADIMIAEAILNEGGELHVTLPFEKPLFIETSVRPYGEAWLNRFHTCLSRAQSVRIISSAADSPAGREHMASLASMGAAIRRADSLSVDSLQFLIWDGQSGPVGTAADAALWGHTNRSQIVLTYPGTRLRFVADETAPKAIESYILINLETDTRRTFDNLGKAVLNALETRKTDPDVCQILMNSAFDLENVETLLKADYGIKGAIVVSERIADAITVHYYDDYSANLIGSINGHSGVYALHIKGRQAII